MAENKEDAAAEGNDNNAKDSDDENAENESERSNEDIGDAFDDIDDTVEDTENIKAQEDDTSAEETEVDVEKLIVIDEITELLDSDNIFHALETYDVDSEEKKTALEFVNSHIQFVREIVENDLKKGIQRRGIEIKDLLGNVNAMLKNRDEYLFTTLIIKSPFIYRHFQGEIYQKSEGQEQDEIEENPAQGEDEETPSPE